MRSSRTLVSLVASSSKYSHSAGAAAKTACIKATQSQVRERWYSSSESKGTSGSHDGGLPPWLTMAGGAVGLGLLARNLLYSKTDQRVLDKKTQNGDENLVIVHDDGDHGDGMESHDGIESVDHSQPAGKDEEEQQQQQEIEKEVNGETENEPKVIVDSRMVLSSVESVLTKTADTMLQEDAERVAAKPGHDTLDSAAYEEHVAGEDNVDVEPAVNSFATTTTMMHQEDIIHKELQEPIQITASKLLDLANKRYKNNAGSYNRDIGIPFEEFSARHKQAEADAVTLQGLLESYKEEHQHQLKQMESTEHALQAALRNLEHMQQELLQAQARALKIQHEKDITRERVKRQEVLDSARLQLDALSDALSRQSARAQKSQQAHKISTAVFHIREGVFLSHPSDAAKMSLDYLLDIKDDPVIQVAAVSLQRCGMSVKKHTQLLSDFEQKVKRPVSELSYIPEGKGGMLTSLAAKIAHALKVETDRDGISKHIQDGELIEAADKMLNMLEGTAAIYAAKDWLEDVKKFAIARQALQVLDARAACINDIHT